MSYYKLTNNCYGNVSIFRVEYMFFKNFSKFPLTTQCHSSGNSALHSVWSYLNVEIEIKNLVNDLNIITEILITLTITIFIISYYAENFFPI
jgi:hypothetical protein